MFRHRQEIGLGGQDSIRVGTEIPVGKAGVKCHRSAPRGECRLLVVRTQRSGFAATLNRVEPALVSAGVETPRAADADRAAKRMTSGKDNDGVGGDGQIVDLSSG